MKYFAAKIAYDATDTEHCNAEQVRRLSVISAERSNTEKTLNSEKHS